MAKRACLVAILVTGCAARPHGATTATGDGKPHGIEAAGLPFEVVDARTGHAVTEAAFWDQLGAARAVCVGEEHPNPHHHWVQLQVVKHLAAKWPHVTLGMEMFQRPFQGVLDDFAAGHIDEEALRSRAGWEDRWGYDYGLYGPTIRATVAAHGALLALNAAKELTKKIVHHGLEALTPDEKKQVPELELHDAAHRAWFDALMEDMGGSSAHSKKPEGEKSEDGEAKPEDKPEAKPEPKADPKHTGGDDGDGGMPSADRIYTVQVVWDETMADTAAAWLAQHPEDHVVILAGTGHCHDSAIVNRMKRRGLKQVVSIRSVIDDGQGGVAEALAKPMNDYVVVLQLPADVKAKLKAAAEADDK